MKCLIGCSGGFLLICLVLSFSSTSVAHAGNLSCYQCIKETNTECESQDLLPCPSVSDRCVTHISKNAEKGFSIKRECGLGPCGFDDEMVNKGLGFGNCDRSKHEYFCIICCKESGCNKNQSSKRTFSHFNLLVSIICFATFYYLY